MGTRFSSKRGRAPTFDDDDENEILRLVLESGKEINSISDEDLRFFAEKVHIEGNLSRERDTRGAIGAQASPKKRRSPRFGPP